MVGRAPLLAEAEGVLAEAEAEGVLAEAEGALAEGGSEDFAEAADSIQISA